MDKLRVGVIGYGYWGPNLVRNLNDLPSVELAVVSDLRKERLDLMQRMFPSVEATQDYHDLFNMGLDAVVVATPPATHHQIAMDCLKKGLHVLVEKPLTLKSSDADELIETSDEFHRVLMVGHTFEYNAAVQTLKKLVASGELGEIYYVDTARLNLGLFQGSNVMWDLAPHDLSILNFILDERPVSVNAQGTCCVFDGVQDVVYMNLRFPKNIMAHVHVSWLEPCKVRRVTVVGSKKMVVYNDIDNDSKIRIYDKGVQLPLEANSFAEFQCSYHYGDVLIPNIRFTEPLRAECQHFIDCIRNGSKPCSCGEDGRNVVKVLEAAQKSLVNSGHMEVLQW